jgi:hyaluronan synthase
MTALGLEFLRQVMQVTFLTYTFFIVSHLVVQTFYAHRAWRQSERLGEREHELEPFAPSVDIVVPAYNEDPERLDRCLASLTKLDYEGPLAIYVCDDGSPNREQCLPVYERYAALPTWTILLPEKNAGKRHAQDALFRLGTGELVVTIDSDTEIAPDALRIVVERFRDPRVGAVTANVGASNARTNLLTRLIGMRYWIAFNQERAAQSYFRTVLCCSGPFSVYRRSALERVWERYLNQTFQGVPCTYGDDRHLTNLVLGEGYDVLYEPRARAQTNVPTTLREYLRQQLRWNKSFYRELLWTFPFLPRRPWYMTFEIVSQVLLPFLLTAAVVSALIFSILVHPWYLFSYLATIAVMACARIGYALYRLRQPRFLLFVLYGFLHAGLLIPVRVRALATLTDNRWGTRGGISRRP